ncbi:MAG: hypothetical protein V7605_233 [Acidimicrobiaceae bacterium]|jgi:hypothetical protein
MGGTARKKREAARAALDKEAADIIDARIADGRPPPDVWQAAAERQAAKGLGAEAWYGTAGDRVTPEGPAGPAPDDLPRTVGDDLVLRVVRLPQISAPVAGPGSSWTGVPRVVTGAPN